MNLTMEIVTAVAVVAVVLAGVGYFVYRPRQAGLGLKERFGPEYDRVVAETGSRKRAEERLLGRQKRVSAYGIRALTDEDRTRFTQLWQNVQAEFVENPKAAATRADEVLAEIMTGRGYPSADFDRRAADLSVDHPVVVQEYRAAHRIVARHDSGKVTTEDLRRAMIKYKTMFSELVSGQVAPAADTPIAPPAETPVSLPAETQITPAETQDTLPDEAKTAA